jgi:deoxyribose-phosphate aldolase
MAESASNSLPGSVELTLSAPQATRADFEKLCAEASTQHYFAVCVNGSRVELVRTLLEESKTLIVALVGFPLGAGDTDAKRYEVEIAVDHGAHEIDFVLNLGRLKDGDSKYVLREMRDIVEASDERPVKAILEAHRLTREEQILACTLAAESGVKYVSAVTGFHTPATTVEEAKALHQAAGSNLKVKCWTTFEAAGTLLEAGAARVGVPFISRQ